MKLVSNDACCRLHDCHKGIAMKMIDGRRLYVDMDGVIANFDEHYINTFGHHPRDAGGNTEQADENMWFNILGKPKFFRNLPLFPGAVEFFRKIEHLNPTMLTSCPHKDKAVYKTIAVEKREYVREHLSTQVTVLPMLHGDCKWLFMHQPGDILIDDWKDNIQHWNEAGGIGIKHIPGDFENTYKQLEPYIIG